eukprot:PhM_4_TR17697/c0_g1_i1/m.24703
MSGRRIPLLDAFISVLRRAAEADGEDNVVWGDVFTDLIKRHDNNTTNGDSIVRDDGVVHIVSSTSKSKSSPSSSSRSSMYAVDTYRATDVLPRPHLNSTTDTDAAVEDELAIDWKHSVLLNLVCECEFKMTIAVVDHVIGQLDVSTLSPDDYRVVTVYANPFRTNMSEKGSPFKCSFPTLYFQVFDFEAEQSKLVLRPGKGLYVDLMGSIPGSDPGIIFKGCVTYGAMVAKLLQYSAAANHQHYVPLAGPRNEGRAQLGVTFRNNLKKFSLRSLLSRGDPEPTTEPLEVTLTYVARDFTETLMCLTEEMRMTGQIHSPKGLVRAAEQRSSESLSGDVIV